MTEGSGWDVEEHPLSASKLKTAERCLTQFRLKYVDRVPQAGQDTYYLDIGNAVHYTIEETLGREKSPTKMSFLTVLPDVLDGVFEATDPDPRQEFPIELDDDQRETVVDCLDTAARWFDKADPSIRGVEVPVEFRIDRPEFDVPVTGFMDLATETGVVDWKTGKSEGKDRDEALQGAVYMAGFYQAYGVPPESVTFVYLKEGTVRTLEPDDDLWMELVRAAETLLTTAAAGEFPATPNESACNWCEYEVSCPASAVGAGNISWETYP